MISKKSLVLCDVNDSSSKKAVMTITCENGQNKGTLRLYNFDFEPSLLTLGIYLDGKVQKSGLTKTANMFYTFFLSEDITNKRFSCAVIEFKNGDAVPLLYGSSEGRQENIYANIIEEISSDASVSNVQNVLDKYGVDYSDDVKEDIADEIDRCIEKNCEECMYKKYYFENIEQKQIEEETANEIDTEQEDVSEVIEDVEDENDELQESFVDRLRPQIDKLFDKNPIEKNLQNIFQNSKFVKIEYEDEGDFYVFGLIYEGDKIKYVCYGVPAVYEEEPPKELSGYPVFVPLDEENTNGFGYWLTYQDAETGEPVKAIIN